MVEWFRSIRTRLNWNVRVVQKKMPSGSSGTGGKTEEKKTEKENETEKEDVEQVEQYDEEDEKGSHNGNFEAADYNQH